MSVHFDLVLAPENYRSRPAHQGTDIAEPLIPYILPASKTAPKYAPVGLLKGGIYMVVEDEVQRMDPDVGSWSGDAAGAGGPRFVVALM